MTESQRTNSRRQEPMHESRIPANRLPRKANGELFDYIAIFAEIADYVRNEIYRVFFFIVDLLILVTGL